MQILKKIWRANIFIRLRSWEYWPFLVVYWPVFIYWFWLSIKAKSLLYFTASNPAIDNGGMLGESKIKILDLLPQSLKPITLYIKPNEPVELAIEAIKKSNLQYPIICKPDIGERGWKVEKTLNEEALRQYHISSEIPFLIQEYLTSPIEMGVFYYRFPNELHGRVSSIVIKEMLTVTGDGKTTLKDLILNNDRAKLQWKKLSAKFNDELNRVLNPSEKIELVPIGNHSKGCLFLNGNHLINSQLNRIFDKISSHISGFYFGRYDIKVDCLDDLYAGKIKIMELNGAGAEPAHIYHPGFSIWEGYRVIFHHWKVLYKISIANHQLGVPYLSIKQGWAEYKKLKPAN